MPSSNGAQTVFKVSLIGLWLIALIGLTTTLILTFNGDPSRFRMESRQVNLELFRIQDGWWFAVCVVVIPLAVWWAGRTRRDVWGARVLTQVSNRWSLYALAASVFAICAAGVFFTNIDFPLSMDEFLATFQANALTRGYVFAPMPNEWADAAPIFQPIFMRYYPDASAWIPGYLPVWASIIALFSKIGAAGLAGAAMAGGAVLMIARLAKQLWPNDRTAPIIAAVFLALSPQFLITSMTSYAMSAHLLFNLVWLSLFLRDDKRGHIGAGVTAFFATGLHQFYVHPLFALPFCVQLLVRKRYRLALCYLGTYVAIILFWFAWRDLSSQILLDFASDSEIPKDTLRTVDRIVQIFGIQKWDELLYVVMNLGRFVGWQFLPVALVFIIGCCRSWSTSTTLTALIVGLILFVLLHLAAMPGQGHGWGYRYLHPLLGNVVLLGVFGVLSLKQAMDAEAWRKTRNVMAILGVVSLLVAIPLRAHQVHAFSTPFANADAYIKSLPYEFVIINSLGTWFAVDLVRNSPFLDTRPKVVVANLLNAPAMRRICRTGPVAVVDIEQLSSFGLKPRPFNPKHIKATRHKLLLALRTRGCKLVFPTVPNAGQN